MQGCSTAHSAWAGYVRAVRIFPDSCIKLMFVALLSSGEEFRYAEVTDIALRMTPLWLIAVAIIAVGAATCEITIAIMRRVDERAGVKIDKGSRGYIVTPIFALLAFMLATTFSMGLSRFDARRVALTAEVNAISTEYLRASLLDDPARAQVRAELRAFAHCRVVPQRVSAEVLASRTRECRSLGAQLWSTTRSAVLPVRTTTLVSVVGGGMNDVLNAASSRDIAARSFIPRRVLIMLLICIVAASAALGLALSDSKQRFRVGPILLLTLYAISFVLILEIDGSMKGAITVSQRPMQELAAQLDANSP